MQGHYIIIFEKVYKTHTIHSKCVGYLTGEVPRPGNAAGGAFCSCLKVLGSISGLSAAYFQHSYTCTGRMVEP